MKRGELIIVWVGGLLSVALLIIVIDPTTSVGEFFNILAKLLAVWIICGLVWLTLYRRHKGD